MQPFTPSGLALPSPNRRTLLRLSLIHMYKRQLWWRRCGE